jgi:hypothetical protein
MLLRFRASAILLGLIVLVGCMSPQSTASRGRFALSSLVTNADNDTNISEVIYGLGWREHRDCRSFKLVKVESIPNPPPTPHFTPIKSELWFVNHCDQGEIKRYIVSLGELPNGNRSISAQHYPRP